MLDILTDVRLSYLRWLADEDQTRQDWYSAYRDYYDGEHDTQLTDRMRRYLQIKAGEEFNDNYCLPPGEQVITATGLANIEDVCEGDVVLGHDGKYHRVLATNIRVVQESIIELRTYGSPHIHMTAGHPVYATRQASLESIAAKYAKQNDTFRCYGMAPNKSYKLASIKREWVPAGELRPGDIVWAPVFSGAGACEPALSRGMLRLLGWYLSEGSASDNGRLAFSFHADEVAYQDEVEQLLRSECGVASTARCVVSEHSLQVVVYDRELCGRFIELGGRGAAGKRIAPDVFNCERALTPLLQALWLGDGTKFNARRIQTDYTTVSAVLASQVQTLLLRHGIVSGLRRRQARLGHRESFVVTVSGAAARALAALLDNVIAGTAWDKAPNGVIVDDYVGHAVAYAKPVWYFGPVHNFETEGCRSYVLPGHVAVHNCPIVVDALVERLQVTGFDAGDADTPSGEGESLTESEQMWEWWTENRGDALQAIVHRAAVRDGDAYVIVSWDAENERPELTFEPAFADDDGVKIHYGDEKRGKAVFASKRWRIKSEDAANAGKKRRLNLYFPDALYKFVSNDEEFEGNWQPYQEEGQPWPLPWVNGAGEPLGIPVFHFKHRDQGYNYGQSELKSVVPLQNALNKTIIDLLAAADTTGFRIFWMIGDDPSGLSISPGSWIYSERPPSGDNAAQVGFFPGEDLSPIIAMKDSIAMEIARVTRTPLSYFQISGQRPAEGTLKQEEVGLVAKAKEAQVVFGNAWEDALKLARALWNTFGPAGMDEDQSISTQWKDPETRNEKEHNEGLKIKAELGIPEEQLWAEMGYDAEKIAEMQKMKDAEEKRRGNVGEQILKAFEQGRGNEQKEDTEEGV